MEGVASRDSGLFKGLDVYKSRECFHNYRGSSTREEGSQHKGLLESASQGKSVRLARVTQQRDKVCGQLKSIYPVRRAGEQVINPAGKTLVSHSGDPVLVPDSIFMSSSCQRRPWEAGVLLQVIVFLPPKWEAGGFIEFPAFDFYPGPPRSNI